MAKKRQPSVLAGLYPGGIPAEYNPAAALDPFAVSRQRQPIAPRNFSIPRGRRDAEISVPRQGITDTAYQLLDRLSPGMGQSVRGPLEATIGPASFENALSRAVSHARGQDVYSDQPDLQNEDALTLGITAAAPTVLKGLGAVGRGLYRLTPEGVRKPLENLAVRAAHGVQDWARENAPVFSRGAHPFAVEPSAVEGNFAVRELPAPEPRLGLPAPGPSLPPHAAKPRGGQWWADKDYNNVFNNSPENAARDAAQALALTRWVPEAEGVVGGFDAQTTPVQQWLEKALTKYYKNDFGSPDDPLRDLAARGLHYDTEMTPEKWQATVNSYLGEDPIQHIMFPPNHAGGMPGAGNNFRGETMAAMPWLAKLPATDKVYSIHSGGLDLSHFADEFHNALNPELSGLPSDLAVRPESLSRMTFPQAVEHVGKINQWRAEEMKRAALDAIEGPATQTFKEYTENNPRGLRWVELRKPQSDNAPEGALAAALKYEGDTMGHCVGGYCPDVESGRSRIFSLRDAKGEPHVTIETQPSSKSTAAADHLRNLGVLRDWQDYWKSYPRTANNSSEDIHDVTQQFLADRGLPPVDYSAQNIIQIKGKQNRAPKDDYMPFVQDFVKSQQWGNVGDLRNTGLVRLPDGRYITNQQAEAGIAAIPDTTVMTREYGGDNMVPMKRVYAPDSLQHVDPDEWANIAEHFKGYAIGGRVSADRCFCRHPLSAKG